MSTIEIETSKNALFGKKILILDLNKKNEHNNYHDKGKTNLIPYIKFT